MSVADLTLEQVEQAIVQRAMALSSGMARWLELVGRYDLLDGATWWGFRSTSEWLAHRCNITARSAREHVRVARRLRELPLVAEAFRSGELSYSQVRAITRAASSEDEARLLEVARSSTAAELERHVRALRSAPSGDLDTAREAHERRYLSWWWEHEGSLRFDGRLTAEDGAQLIEAVESAAELITGEVPPPRGARRADALAEILHSGAPPARVMLHVDASSLGQVCSLEDGPSVPPESARRLACDAEFALGRGRTTRNVSGPLRRSLERRDGSCRFPGCVRRHGLHAHHIQHWIHGGATDPENLVLVCRFHHRLLHEEQFTVRRMEDGSLRFRRPDGRFIPQVTMRAPPLLLAA